MAARPEPGHAMDAQIPMPQCAVGSNGMPGPLQAQQEVRVRHLGTVYPVTSPHSFREALGSF